MHTLARNTYNTRFCVHFGHVIFIFRSWLHHCERRVVGGISIRDTNIARDIALIFMLINGENVHGLPLYEGAFG